jgi:transcriptional regulator with XRE-family HTH domain
MTKERNFKVRQWLALNVKYARTIRGLTQEALAESAGIDRTSVSGIERMVKGASVDSICSLADAIGVAPHTLLLPPEDAHPHILGALKK